MSPAIPALKSGRLRTLLFSSVLFAHLVAAAGPADAQPQENANVVSVVEAGERRSLLADFPKGPLISMIHETIKDEIHNSTQGIEKQVAKIVAKQIGDQVISDMSNMTSGALNSMGFSNPQQLGQYIGSWAGWLVTILTSAANTVIVHGGGGGGGVGGGGGDDDVIAGPTEGTDEVTVNVAGPGADGEEYGNVSNEAGGGSGAVNAAVLGNVTEADLLRLQGVLRQLHELHEKMPSVGKASASAAAAAGGSPGAAGAAYGSGPTNRTALEEAVSKLVWRALLKKESMTAGDGGDGGGSAVPFRAVADGGDVPVGPVRGLTGTNDLPTDANGNGNDSDGDDGDDAAAAAAAAAALRGALEKNDVAAASEAVAALLDSLRIGDARIATSFDNGSGGGDVITPTSIAVPPAAAASPQLVPLPKARGPKPAKAGGPSRPIRPGPIDGPNVNVGRDLNGRTARSRQLAEASVNKISYGRGKRYADSPDATEDTDAAALDPIELRYSTGSGPGNAYGSEYDTEDTAKTTATASLASDDQVLDFIQALITRVAGPQVAVKVGVDDGGGAAATAAAAAGADAIRTRQAVPFPQVASRSRVDDKPANANVNPIVLPGLQRSGPEISHGGVGKLSAPCPPCRC
ncbi:hypothetical protein VOLCADRAFT_91272 [Volvox carteri f. nagariensis]|uniref:Uncharacterized protein n=1 Tax=Volvox carteri f. nagariensis TaxID=3068 RepID=D8TWL8_VOLCA|nr:uncharacterized protein VOLCADRAFT_91272 [Volvox carteri f. nagariensis]EFJ48072.1 hypothetical protein VOLCADRAFT_91272 [Volvox carteri f. nagariensis]|eukprot:XP_002950757.1 hypothetical protein VOLCADRAFT_91272 [Volvox carteri f. nagariensis]